MLFNGVPGHSKFEQLVPYNYGLASQQIKPHGPGGDPATALYIQDKLSHAIKDESLYKIDPPKPKKESFLHRIEDDIKGDYNSLKTWTMGHKLVAGLSLLAILAGVLALLAFKFPAVRRLVAYPKVFLGAGALGFLSLVGLLLYNKYGPKMA